MVGDWASAVFSSVLPRRKGYKRQVISLRQGKERIATFGLAVLPVGENELDPCVQTTSSYLTVDELEEAARAFSSPR